MEEACEIAVHQLLQDSAADAVIEKPVIAAVERPNAAEKARIVDRDHKGRKANSGQRQDGPRPLNAHQRYDKACKTGESESADQKLPRPDGPRRIDPHGECVWNDCDAEYAPAGVGRFDRAATFARPAREALVFAFPHHGAAPAQRAANVTGRNPDHLEPRHREMPAMPAHPEPAVARRARYIVAACPVVSPIIDEAEPQPDGVVKIERHRHARCGGPAPDTVGRKCERPIRETAVLPTARLLRVAASRDRILRVKLGKHLAVNVGR